jgi:hypothetical protein
MGDEFVRSPVPRDGTLEADVLPFTAFGQFGVDTLDKRVFEQDVWWVDRFGQGHLVSEMSADYLRAVIGYCEANVRSFWVGAVLREQLGALGAKCGSEDGLGEQVVSELGFGSALDCEPETWLESTPLMRALQRQLDVASR